MGFFALASPSEGSGSDFQEGEAVRVKSCSDSMLKACRMAGISEENDGMRQKFLGQEVRILTLDTEDGTAKVGAGGVGEVWLAIGAIALALDSNEKAHKIRSGSMWKSAWAHLEQTRKAWTDRDDLSPDKTEEGSRSDFQEGDAVRVTSCSDSMLKACRLAGISEKNDGMRQKFLGHKVRILTLDTKDGTAKVGVEGVDEVWLAMGAFALASPEEESGSDFQEGDAVRVTSCFDSMLNACRLANISEKNDGMRQNFLGHKVRILTLDTEDGTAKVGAGGVGEVWLAIGAFALA